MTIFTSAHHSVIACYDAMQQAILEGRLPEVLASMSDSERECFHALRAQLWCLIDAYDEVATLAVEYGVPLQG